MNLIERLKVHSLPIKQQRVIEKILDDLETNSFLNGNELCDKFDISFSSLTRLAKGLGYSGFPELKKEVERLYREEFSPTQKAESFVKDMRQKSILNLVYQSELRNLNKLMGQLHETDVLRCAKRINSSSRAIVIGIGQMATIANKFSESLKLLSRDVVCLTEIGFSKKSEVLQLSKDDIVICFSINKELIEMKGFLEQARSNGIHSILFTDKKAGLLTKVSDQTFYAPSSGHGMINCLTAFMVLTNILESTLFSLDKHVHLAKIRNIEKKWNSLPIFI